MNKQPSNMQHYIGMAKTAVLAGGLLWFGVVALTTLMGY